MRRVAKSVLPTLMLSDLPSNTVNGHSGQPLGSWRWVGWGVLSGVGGLKSNARWCVHVEMCCRQEMGLRTSVYMWILMDYSDYSSGWP